MRRGHVTFFSHFVHLVCVLTFSPLLTSGVDHTISPNDLMRGLQRIRDNGVKDSMRRVEDAIRCVQMCDKNTQQLIIREVLIRNNYKTFNEACTTYNTTYSITYNATSSTTISTEKFLTEPPDPTLFVQDYLAWQEKILDKKGGFIFCDPFQNLHCTKERKCDCRSGTTWRTGVQQRGQRTSYNYCVISPGGLCMKDQRSIGPTYFDPLESSMNMLRKMSPLPQHCQPLVEFSDTCMTEPLFSGTHCINKDLDQRMKPLNDYFRATTMTGLALDATCNFEEHSRLFTSTPSENFVGRLQALEKLQMSGVKTFCDIGKLLTCGKSGKCECMPPTFLSTDGTQNCILPVALRTCGPNEELKKMINANENLVTQAKLIFFDGLGKQLTDGCTGSFKCHVDSTDMFCTCKAFLAGDHCTEPLTGFLHFLRPSVFAENVTDETEKMRLFTAMNRKAVEFEKKLVLPEGATCDFQKELEVRRLIRRIEPYDKRGTIRYKANYETLTTDLTNFLNAAGQANYCLRQFDRGADLMTTDTIVPFFSPYGQAIECNFTTKKCGRPMYQSSPIVIGDGHRLLLEESFTTLKCGTTCDPSKSIVPSPDETSPSSTEAIIDRFEGLMFDKTQFCSESPSRLVCPESRKTCVCNGPILFCPDCSGNNSLLSLNPNSTASNMMRMRTGVPSGIFAAIFGLHLLWI